MKVDDKLYAMESSGLGEQNSFTIKASGKAFKILSSQLYSNKIQAILRELGTNAVDAQISANNEVPFEVNLPGFLDTNFSIRDYGTGLSPSDLETIYTTYFKSTRENSNDFTGCLGLGSKSPFCYTENFTIDDFYNGVKYTYLAFINEQGFPAISKIAEKPTKEHNGMKISFATKIGDQSTWEQEAIKVYSVFKVRPKIVSHPNFRFTEYEVLLADKNWKFVKGSGDYIIMGNVCYPCKMSRISYRPANCALIINANIGDVEFTASREALEYTDRTNNYIAAETELITKELKVAIQKTVDSFSTYYDACCWYFDNNWVTDKFSFGRKELARHANRKGHDVKDATTGGTIYQSVYSFTTVSSNWRRKSLKFDNVNYVNYDRKQTLVYDDLKKGGLARIKKYYRDETAKNKNPQIIVIYGDLNEFLKDSEIPLDKIVKSSTLDKVVYVKGASPEKRKIFKYCSGYTYGPRNCLESVIYDDKLQGAYLKMNMYHVESGYRLDNLDGYKKILESEGLGEIYLIPASAVIKPEKGKLKHLNEVVADLKKKYDNKKDLISHSDKFLEFSELTKIEKYTENKELQVLIEKIKEVNKNNKLYTSLRNIIPPDTATTIDTKILNKYSILKQLVDRRVLDLVDKKELEQYIKIRENRNV